MATLMTKIWPEKDVSLISSFGHTLLKLNLANVVRTYSKLIYGELSEQWAAIYEREEDAD